jgi:hypothetical protein
MTKNRNASVALGVSILLLSSLPSAAQTWNAWPRDEGWGSVPPFGLGFNWRRPYIIGGIDYAPTADAVAYCARRFRTYDATTQTYLARDGLRYYCP